MFEIGEQARDEGRLEDAERAFRAVLADEPEHFGALYNLGKLLWDRREADQAVPLLEEAARLAPAQPGLQLMLARLLNRMGRYEVAEELCRRLLEQEPAQADAHELLGRLLARRGQHNEAARSWSEALKHEPGHPRASMQLAAALLGMYQTGKAARVIQAARERHPQLPVLKVRHAAILAEMQDYDAALALLDEVPEDAPARDAALACRAEILIALDQPEQALDVLEGAASSAEPALVLARARAQKMLDEPGEAASRLRELLARHPRHEGAWEELCQVSPEAVSGRDLLELKQLRHNGFTRTRVRFGFALARVARAREDLEAELNMLEDANACQRSELPYPRQQLESFHGALRGGVTRGWLAELGKKTGTASEFEPVFLIGLPFSGTALAEQLLRAAGWPALGQAPMMRQLLRELLRVFERGNPARLMEDPPEEMVTTFARGARQWLTEKGGLASGPFVERNWIDFQYLPLLHAAFPSARFVQLRRDPADWAVANFRHLFEQGHAYSYDLADAAHTLAEHEKLLEHWRTLGIRVTELSLEELAADPESALAGAGLPGPSDPGAARRLEHWRREIGQARRYPRWRTTLDEALQQLPSRQQETEQP